MKAKKIYDRKYKRQVDLAEFERSGSLKKRELCRGQRPHNFVLVMPEGITPTKDYRGDPNVYYKLMDERITFLEDLYKRLTAAGIETHYKPWYVANRKLWVCTVCGKRNLRD